MTSRTKFSLIAIGIAILVLLFFLSRLFLGNSERLLDHVSQASTTAIRVSLWAGTDPNFRDEQGGSVLQTAVELGDSEIVRMLLDAGADPNTHTSDGKPVVVEAAQRDETKILGMLLDAGADARGPGVLETTLQHATLAIAQILLDAGATPVEDLKALAKARRTVRTLSTGPWQLSKLQEPLLKECCASSAWDSAASCFNADSLMRAAAPGSRPVRGIPRSRGSSSLLATSG